MTEEEIINLINDEELQYNIKADFTKVVIAIKENPKAVDLNKKMEILDGDSIFDLICEIKAVGNNTIPDNFIDFLLDNGADINSISLIGLTPLMNAVHCKNIEFVKQLLSYNADIFVQDKGDAEDLTKTVLHDILWKIWWDGVENGSKRGYLDESALYEIANLLIKKLEELTKR